MQTAPPKLRLLHRTSAFLVAAFAAIHIANHLASLASIEAHIAFMEAARAVYRQPVVEAVLLACVLFQFASGSWLVARGWKARQGRIAWLQAASGMTLGLFLLVHVGAVLWGRSLGLDTNFHFAAAGFHVPPFAFFFAPYYLLAVLALFTHIGCALSWQLPEGGGARRLAVAAPAAIGGVVALLLVLSLAGQVQPFEVPAAYKATYAR